VLVSVLVLTSVSKNVLRLEGSSGPSFFKITVDLLLNLRYTMYMVGELVATR